jgi:hypothetical protein
MSTKSTLQGLNGCTVNTKSGLAIRHSETVELLFRLVGLRQAITYLQQGAVVGIYALSSRKSF